MTDLLDQARKYEERHRQAAIEAQRKKAATQRESATHCVDCDDPIPQARQTARPGVQTCIHCQTEREAA